MISPNYDDLPPPVNPGSRYGFKLHTERWLIFGIAMALNFANSMYSTTFIDLKPRINDTIGFFCNGTSDCHHLDSIIEFSYAGIFMLSVYPSILFCLKMKLKRTFILGSLITIFGGIIRLSGSLSAFSVPFRYYLTICGHLIVACAHPLLLCTAPVVAQKWFPTYQRTFATSLILYAHFCGQMFNFIAIPLMTNFLDEDWSYLILNTIPIIICSISLGATWLLSKGSPTMPASASSDGKAVMFQPGNNLFVQPAFLAQIILFAISFGSFKFISLWQFSLLCLQGYLPTGFKGFYTFFLLGSTLAGALLLSAIIDQFHKYKKVYRFCFALTTFGIGLFAWVLQKEDRTITLMVAFFIIGFFGIGSLGIGMETSCETVFPIDSGIVSGMLLAAGYFFYILLAVGTYFTRNLVSAEEYPIEQCSHGLYYQFYEFSDTTEVLSFITCSGLVLCLLGLHARRRRYDYEAAAKLMRISVFNSSQTAAPFQHYPTASTSQTHLATEF